MVVAGCVQAKRPVLYVGGGCLDSAAEIRELVSRTGIPVVQTLMGLGTFPESDPLALQARHFRKRSFLHCIPLLSFSFSDKALLSSIYVGLLRLWYARRHRQCEVNWSRFCSAIERQVRKSRSS
jgi:hypothetical protein